jgi:ribosomal protein L27
MTCIVQMPEHRSPRVELGSCLFIAHETYVALCCAATRMHLRHGVDSIEADINVAVFSIIVSNRGTRQDPQAIVDSCSSDSLFVTQHCRGGVIVEYQHRTITKHAAEVE